MLTAVGGAKLATWGVAALAIGGVILRPRRLPEALWAVLGALVLVITRLLPWGVALRAVGEGTDVYLFLVGMMLLSEVARRERLFDWLAAHAVHLAGGSARRLFLLVYGVGTVVTMFLSNDATAVVLTPAVFAAVRAARAEPLPYLFVCPFIANAASFVLPISNPANLVLYASHTPPLLSWLGHFLVPSALAIASTLAVLLLMDRTSPRGSISADVTQPILPAGGRLAAIGILATVIILMAASAAGFQLGIPTALAGIATSAIVLVRQREAPWGVLRGVSWLVLPLVAGLFVLVAGLKQTDVLGQLSDLLHRAAAYSDMGAAAGGSALLALACNLMNNLPAGLIASSAMASEHPPARVVDALLIGVDLGPNLSVTGSLATILWLTALRRKGLDVGFGAFLVRGAVLMPVALLLALAGLLAL